MSPPASAQPGRYQRSAGGMVGALVVLLLAIGAFVAFRAVTRAQPEVRPERVDYLQSVGLAQRAGRDIVYPAELPAGWIATRADFGSSADPAWGLTMLTDADEFVGVRQDTQDLPVLLERYVDERPAEGDPVDIESSVAPTWRRFTDEGGDTAYAAQVDPDDAWVLVYGSATAPELIEIVERLTDAPR